MVALILSALIALVAGYLGWTFGYKFGRSRGFSAGMDEGYSKGMKEMSEEKDRIFKVLGSR